MIDVHVLTHSGTRPLWLAQCLDSLAAEPCTVHVVQGTEGSIAAGRARGFALGSHPYVTYVDSDDYVLPGAMAAVVRALEGGLDAVTTGEMILRGKTLLGPNYGHALFALRRSVLEPHLARYAADFQQVFCTRALSSIASPVQLSEVAYVWRIHAGQSHRTNRVS